MSNFPCSLTRNTTSHSVENLAFHSLLRWKSFEEFFILQILISRYHKAVGTVPGNFEQCPHGMLVCEWCCAISQLNCSDPQGPDVAAHIVTVIKLLLTCNHLQVITSGEIVHHFHTYRPAQGSAWLSYGRNETWPELWAGMWCCSYGTSSKGRRVGRLRQLCCAVSEIVRRPRIWVSGFNTPKRMWQC